ncbi:MAG: EamA-like transporter family protein [Coleofasciculus sp. S288]|nr:EamA-like transporter family protein [Coleofasciculus sp. S288]
MTPQELTLLFMTVSIGAVGQYFLKAGALKIAAVSASSLISRIWGILTIPELLAGMVCYGLGAVGLVILLSRVKLSVVGPSIALSYVFSVLIGYFLFREAIPVSRLVGLALIVSGVILVVWKN